MLSLQLYLCNKKLLFKCLWNFSSSMNKTREIVVLFALFARNKYDEERKKEKNNIRVSRSGGTT